MKRKNKRKLIAALALFGMFLLWTVLVVTVDVKVAGPQGSKVGFASLNTFVHKLTGVHMPLYTVTDILSVIPLGTVLLFAIVGLGQWKIRKKITCVDRSLWVLGGAYAVTLAAFVLFEVITVNYRPVLIDGVLEKSYPSSTTMLVMCVMPTSLMQLRSYIKNSVTRNVVSVVTTAFTVFMVIGRLVSGVHWVTDIIGGAWFSLGLVMAYSAVCGLEYSKTDQK